MNKLDLKIKSIALEDMKKIATCGGKNSFCYACFDGVYPTELPKPSQPNKYEMKINIEEKTKRHI